MSVTVPPFPPRAIIRKRPETIMRLIKFSLCVDETVAQLTGDAVAADYRLKAGPVQYLAVFHAVSETPP
jgi:hypothetical protein